MAQLVFSTHMKKQKPKAMKCASLFIIPPLVSGNWRPWDLLAGPGPSERPWLKKMGMVQEQHLTCPLPAPSPPRPPGIHIVLAGPSVVPTRGLQEERTCPMTLSGFLTVSLTSTFTWYPPLCCDAPGVKQTLTLSP